MKKTIPKRSDFSDDELEVINEIIIKLVVVFEKLLENMRAKDLLQLSSKISSSLQTQVTVAYITKLQGLCGERGKFTDELKEEIANMLSEERQQALLNNESLMSKVLKDFENGDVIFKERGKKHVKAQLPRSILRKPKAGRSKRVGPYIISKFTNTVEGYKRVLSNPKAVELINNRLLKYGLLKKTYSKIIRESFRAFKEGDNSFYKTLKMLLTDIDDSPLPDPQLFQERLKSLSEAEIENLQEQAIAHLVENPNYPVFFIFSLYKLGVLN